MDLVQFARKSITSNGLGGAGRYAPSPTGPLHLGNLQTALLAWLQARLSGARFILRIEDLDRDRVLPDGDSLLMEELDWLGIDWDEGPYYQSERISLYNAVFARMQKEGLLYPCFCTRREIRDAVGAPHGAPPIYPGFCREMSDAQLIEKKANLGRGPSWRYRSDPIVITFEDAVAGEIEEDQEREVGDYPVRRADYCYTYQFAVSVDDWAMGVTNVVRGADLLSSTGRQIALIRKLIELDSVENLTTQGHPERSPLHIEKPPRYWHTPLVCDQNGERLSKRDAACEVGKERGPEAVVGDIVKRLQNGNDSPLNYRKISALDLLDALKNCSSQS